MGCKRDITKPKTRVQGPKVSFFSLPVCNHQAIDPCKITHAVVLRGNVDFDVFV